MGCKDNNKEEMADFLKGVCNVVPMVKPRAFAASYAADRLKEILSTQQLYKIAA